MGNQMNPSREDETHDLFIRLDERSFTTEKYILEIREHLVEQNGFIRDCMVRSHVNRILIGIGGSVLVLIIAALITNARGVW